MGNSIFNIFGGGGGNLFAQAVGAFMRGEDPKAFLQNLANTNPALRGLDLTDINATARRVCQQHGVDPDKLAAEIQQKVK